MWRESAEPSPRISPRATPRGASTIRGCDQRPVTVSRAVPGDSGVPISRNQAAPNRAMSAACASDSTFCTRVGRPPTPWSRTVRNPVKLGVATPCPAMVFTAADSWPARNRSGAATTSMGTGSRARCRLDSMADLMAVVAPDGTYIRISDAPIHRAAMDAPSRTRWGSWWMSIRSLPLAGSPSAPFPTTTGLRNLVPPTDRHLAATGNHAPPWPRSPLTSSSRRNVAASQFGR